MEADMIRHLPTTPQERVMLIFYGANKSQDEAVLRAAKLKVLKAHFNESEHAKAVNMLADDELGAKSGVSNQTLIINAHGNQDSFQGFSADDLFAILRGKGFCRERWQNIYLIACKVGLQEQDNSVLSNFARDFNRLVQTTPETSGMKVYAPRGTVRYTGRHVKEVGNGQQTIEFTGVCVHTDERDYPLSEGLLLQMP
jgi:hypothetical protein